jgi:glycosyltransferase involved in cell wall biosynthesis
MRGVQYLLLAWEQFADNKDDVHLRIAGGRADNFPKDLYNRFARRDDITFHGYINDVDSLYAESHVFVLPSLYDGGPCGPLEAMSTGTPAIVSETMGAEMDVNDGETGFVVPTRDATAIADRLERLYQEPSLQETMAQQAREHASSVPGREREEFAPPFRRFAE